MQGRAVLWTFMLSGVMSLALEIVWFRMLVTLLRPTAYAFTIMLAAVLAGIALGSAIAAPFLRRGRRWLEALTVVQLAIAAAAVLSLNALGHFDSGARDDRARCWHGSASTPTWRRSSSPASRRCCRRRCSSGSRFLSACRCGPGASDSSRRIGAFYSLNVCGAIAGSILGGFVLLPLLGSRGSLIADGSARAALERRARAVAVAAAAELRRVHRHRRAGGLRDGALNADEPVRASSRAPSIATSACCGVKRACRRRSPFTSSAAAARNASCSSTACTRRATLPQMAFVHHRIGAMPVMLHPDPKDALVVGLGGGATAGAVARFPGITVDVVELSSAVVAAPTFFTHINFDLLQRPERPRFGWTTGATTC